MKRAKRNNTENEESGKEIESRLILGSSSALSRIYEFLFLCVSSPSLALYSLASSSDSLCSLSLSSFSFICLSAPLLWIVECRRERSPRLCISLFRPLKFAYYFPRLSLFLSLESILFLLSPSFILSKIYGVSLFVCVFFSCISKFSVIFHLYLDFLSQTSAPGLPHILGIGVKSQRETTTFHDISAISFCSNYLSYFECRISIIFLLPFFFYRC